MPLLGTNGPTRRRQPTAGPTRDRRRRSREETALQDPPGGLRPAWSELQHTHPDPVGRVGPLAGPVGLLSFAATGPGRPGVSLCRRAGVFFDVLRHGTPLPVTSTEEGRHLTILGWTGASRRPWRLAETVACLL